jgi:hypothetical protein
MTGKKRQPDNVDFTRFENLTRRLVAVPKKEVDAQREKILTTKTKASEK